MAPDPMKVQPAERTVSLPCGARRATALVEAACRDLGGRVTHTDGDTVVSDFGSLLWSRLLGEFWVSKRLLPSTATIRVRHDSRGLGALTHMTILVRDRHRFGIKWGYAEKYRRALEGVADDLSTKVRRGALDTRPR